MSWFQDKHEEFQWMNYQVAGMSIDSVFALNVFRERLLLPFHLLSDANRNVSRSLGILLPEVAGIQNVACRSVMFIDKSRQIQRWGHDVTLPDFDRIFNEIKNTAGK